MSAVIVVATVFSLGYFAFVQSAYAQRTTPPPASPAADLAVFEATQDAEATVSAIEQVPEPPVDITQTDSQNRLTVYLEQHPAPPLAPWNVVQHALRNAVQRGIPANVLVLLLLFPVTATITAIFRHLIGLRGFGIYTPAVLSVAFVSLGIVKGLLLFSVVFGTVLLGRPLVSWVRLQYLPRTALLIWLVSTAMFALLAASPYLPIPELGTVGIFPLLMLVLLSEHFLDAQLFGNVRKAVELTGETLVLAIISALFLRTIEVREFVVLYPEITMVAVLIINVLVGKYTGLRVSEFFRFKPIIDSEE